VGELGWAGQGNTGGRAGLGRVGHPACIRTPGFAPTACSFVRPLPALCPTCPPTMTNPSLPSHLRPACRLQCAASTAWCTTSPPSRPAPSNGSEPGLALRRQVAAWRLAGMPKGACSAGSRPGRTHQTHCIASFAFCRSTSASILVYSDATHTIRVCLVREQTNGAEVSGGGWGHCVKRCRRDLALRASSTAELSRPMRGLHGSLCSANRPGVRAV
jgi:hypothetical protein